MKRLITIIILAVMLCGVTAHADYYPLLTVVVECEQAEEQNTNIVTCVDRYGNLWSFYDDEDFWTIGDLCNLLMFRPYGLYEEDMIIDSSYEGKIF